MMSLSVRFNHSPEIEHKTILVLPFKTDVNNLIWQLPKDCAIVGGIYSLEQFIGKLFGELCFEHSRVRPATRFAIVHRLLLDSNFFDRIDDAYKFSIGTAEALVQLFAMCDFAGILSEEEIFSLHKMADGRTKRALELYRRFRKELSYRKLVTEGDRFRTIARRIRELEKIKWIAQTEKIVFHNFLEFSVPQRELIRALSEMLDVVISFPLSSSEYPAGWRAPIKKMMQNLGIPIPEQNEDTVSPHWLAMALNENYSSRIAEQLQWKENKIPNSAFLKPPDQSREVEFVAKVAKLLILNEGIEPHQLLVVPANVDIYSPLLAAEFDKYGVPHSIDVQETAMLNILTLLKNIVSAMRTDMRRNETISLLEHPLLKRQFSTSQIEEIKRWAIKNKIRGGDDWLKYDDVNFVPIRRAIVGIRELNKKFPASSLKEILEEIYDALQLELTTSKMKNSIRRQFYEQWNSLTERAEELADGYGKNTKLPCEHLIMSLMHVHRNHHIPFRREQKGVQILPIAEARNNHAKVAFYIGFSQDYFPMRHRKNPILSQEYDEFLPEISDRTGVGNLSLLQGLMSTERFFLSFPTVKDEQYTRHGLPIDEIIRFCMNTPEMDKPVNIEEILSDNTVRLFEHLSRFRFGKTDISAFSVSYGKTQKLQPDHLSEISSSILRKITVSKMEEYEMCPYRLVLKKLVGEPEPEEISPVLGRDVLGNIVHKSFFEFYSTRFSNATGEESLKQYDLSPEMICAFLRRHRAIDDAGFNQLRQMVAITEENIAESVSQFTEILRNKLAELWQSEHPYMLIDQIEYDTGFDERFIKRILRSELEHYDNERWLLPRLPVAFELDVQVPLELENGNALVVGRVDRVDIFPDGTCTIIDYKTGALSKNLRNSKNEKINLKEELQLQAYSALLNMAFGTKTSTIAYITRITDWFNGPSVFIASLNDEELESARERILEILNRIAQCDFTPKDVCEKCEYVRYCNATS